MEETTVPALTAAISTERERFQGEGYLPALPAPGQASPSTRAPGAVSASCLYLEVKGVESSEEAALMRGRVVSTACALPKQRDHRGSARQRPLLLSGSVWWQAYSWRPAWSPWCWATFRRRRSTSPMWCLVGAAGQAAGRSRRSSSC